MDYNNKMKPIEDNTGLKIRLKKDGHMSRYQDSWSNVTGVAKTIFVTDGVKVPYIKWNADSPLLTPEDLGIELRDGATYEIVVSMLEGKTGTSLNASDNFVGPVLLHENRTKIGNLSASGPPTSAVTNSLSTFRYQYHDSVFDEDKGIYNIMPSSGSGAVMIFQYTSQLGMHVDNPSASAFNASTGTPTSVGRAEIDKRERLRLGIGSYGSNPTTCDCYLFVKVTERTSDNPQDEG